MPVPDPANLTGGADIPVLSWSAVQGAVSYGMHVEQADGTRKDFVTTSTSIAPTTFYAGHLALVGAGELPRRLVRRLLDPCRLHPPHRRSREGCRTQVGRSDAAELGAEHGSQGIRGAISTDPDFRTVVDSGQPQESNWAPKLTAGAYRAGGRLHWRIAAIDEGGNIGAWSNGIFTLRKALVLSVRGSAPRGERGRFTVLVKDMAGRKVNGARVAVRGAGAKRASKRTRKGAAAFMLRPRKRGTSCSRSASAGTDGTARVPIP